MAVHKLTSHRLSLGWLLLFAYTVSGLTVQAEPSALPALDDTQRFYLSRIARRTLRDAALGRATYQPSYVPESLRDLRGEVIVRCRLEGYLVAETGVGPGPLVSVTRNAALASAKSMMADGKIDLDIANQLLIEIERIGPVEPIADPGDWTRRGALDGVIEPGVHGITLSGAGLDVRFCPTEVTTSDRCLDDILKALAKSTLHNPDDVSKVALGRFETDHWYQEGVGGSPIRLQRGLTIVDPSTVSRAGLSKSIDALVAHMLDRQLDSGLFTYEYEPGRNIFSEDNSPIRQIGAAVAMAHSARDGSQPSRLAADRAIQFHLQGLVPLPGFDDAVFVSTADDKNRLGATALLCQALGEYADSDKYADTRKRLVKAMMQLQRPSGMFVTAFPPAMSVEGQDQFPGQTLLAMAIQYGHAPSGRILDIFNQAREYYSLYFREKPNGIFAAWNVRAFASMAEWTKREDFAQFVFKLADWIVARQLTDENCRWPELYGGIASQRPAFADFTTGIQLQALADALRLARVRGDKERATTYERAVRAAARFVMQLQVRPEETYYMRSPRDAIGAIRTHLSLNLLRIDHCAHALIGLLKAKEVLFPSED